MRELCEDSGVELILVKSPTNSWRYPWYDEWDAEIREYATEQGISYYNFIGVLDIGLDMTQDTYDGGAHLNVYGAEKLTAYFGAISFDRARFRGTLPCIRNRAGGYADSRK
jgi:hypothetical protein